MLRAAVAAKTPLGIKAKEAMDKVMLFGFNKKNKKNGKGGGITI
jgi:hypothetical protein